MLDSLGVSFSSFDETDPLPSAKPVKAKAKKS
jgi:hypothetical protein